MQELEIVKNVDVYIENDIAYLKLEDVARGLGITQKAKSGNEVVRWERLKGYLEEFQFIPTSGDGNTNLVNTMKDSYIPENIFYRLCMKANNEVARKFQDYVCTVILPSIRKHGAYMSGDVIKKVLNSPEFLIELAKKLQEEEEARKRLEQKIEQDKPRIAFCETIEKASEGILIRDFCKILGNQGIDLGQNRLYNKLREWGYIFKNSTEPTQVAVKQGLFYVNEMVIATSKGGKIKHTTYLTGKGQVFLLNKIKKELVGQ